MYYWANWYPKGTLSEPFVPQEISDAQLIFPANVAHLMPPAEKIPDEFRDPNEVRYNKWGELFNSWFFGGIDANVTLDPHAGIDVNLAWRHLRAIAGSYEPKHEYKQAAVAYLLSLWFDDVHYAEKEAEDATPV